MFAEVIIDVQNSEVDKVYDYIIPPSLSLIQGMRVVVPFGKRVIEGFIIAIKPFSRLAPERLKEIIKPLDSQPVILPEMLKLTKFMVERYNIKIVDALRLFIPNEFRKGQIKELLKTYCILNDKIDVEAYKNSLRATSHKQKALIEYMQAKKIEEQASLNKLFSSSAVSKLKNEKILKTTQQEVSRKPEEWKINKKKVEHTAEQKRAIEAISTFPQKTFLLHGVTGSGKTEVYMSLIEKVLQNGQTAIMLVPEISLTPQVLGNFKSRLGDDVAILHSGLSAGEKYDEWRRLLMGKARVVVGARSGIFAPLQNVGLIVIDEEHESTYNSESNPRYKTHEIAEFRAKFNHCPLILGSATPSINSYNDSLTNKSTLLELPTRANQKEMPTIQIVDMLMEMRMGNTSMFSRQLIDDLFNCIKENKQALLFLNRRGFTSFMRCNECGYIAKCTDCDISLVYHKFEEKLKCHYCGKRFKALTSCPQCGSQYIRQGAIGTQKVVEEVARLFPDVTIFRMDNDTTQNKNSHQKILAEFANTKPAILVGTQMIAKGHDFDSVSLVGVVDADQSLYQTDYKSAERTFQLITQVSGRAGRKEGGGKIVLQTYNPKHYVYKFAANYNYKGFFEKEINIREVTKFPPFASIIRILITHENEPVVQKVTKAIYEDLCTVENKYKDDFFYFEAMKSPHSKIKNKIRYQLLLRFTKDKECDILKEVYEVVNKYKSSKASVFVEIDPQSLA